MQSALQGFRHVAFVPKFQNVFQRKFLSDVLYNIFFCINYLNYYTLYMTETIKCHNMCEAEVANVKRYTKYARVILS